MTVNPRLTVIMFGKRELRRHCRKLGLLIPVKMQARGFVSHKDDGLPEGSQKEPNYESSILLFLPFATPDQVLLSFAFSFVSVSI